MASQTDISSDLINNDKAVVFQILDNWLNSRILYALLYGGHQHLVSPHVDVD